MKKTNFPPLLVPLFAIALAALLLLGAAVSLQSIASANAQREHQRLLQTLLPGSTEFSLVPYTGDDSGIRSVHRGEGGYVIEVATHGYAGEVTVLVGVKNDGTAVGIVVRDMSETFSLGANALGDVPFLSQFLGKSGTFTVGTGTEDAFSGATGDTQASAGTEITVDAITGATVTSKAIARCVNSAVAYVTGTDADSGATSWGGAS
ncbi:MAG: FMN-binding protein [Clostridia bacterium]|nr:FMN-binding protein [Clostridia bacterium]